MHATGEPSQTSFLQSFTWLPSVCKYVADLTCGTLWAILTCLATQELVALLEDAGFEGLHPFGSLKEDIVVLALQGDSQKVAFSNGKFMLRRNSASLKRPGVSAYPCSAFCCSQIPFFAGSAQA